MWWGMQWQTLTGKQLLLDLNTYWLVCAACRWDVWNCKHVWSRCMWWGMQWRMLTRKQLLLDFNIELVSVCILPVSLWK
jgi:hypothetical protein